MKTCLTLLFLLLLMNACQPVSPLSYEAPEQEKKSNDFEMFVNGKSVFVYQARVSKFPVNQVWPGFQRPLNQTEISSFAYFDFKHEVEIKIVSNKKIKTLNIRPTEYGLKPVIKGNLVYIRIASPCQFTVEINGYHNALHVFANPMERVRIDKKDTAVLYFGPGVHEAGTINLKSNQTVYLAGGAIVHGVIVSENTRNVKVLGRGILDAGKIARNGAPNMITFRNVTNGLVKGIILRDAHEWGIVSTGCDSLVFDNIKLIGFWRYNSDGIDLVNSKNISVKNSFIRSFDDNIVIKGFRGSYDKRFKLIENISADSCVLWNDWGRALEIGAETVADTIRNVWFSHCYIPHYTTVAMDIQNCDRGVIKDIHYQDISVEGLISDSLTLGKMPIFTNAWGKMIVLGIYKSYYSSDSLLGQIENIHFNNIRYRDNNISRIYQTKYDSMIIFDDKTKFIRDNMYFGDIKLNSTLPNSIYLSGFDRSHEIKNIYIKDYCRNGQKVTDRSAIGLNEFVKNIFIE